MGGAGLRLRLSRHQYRQTIRQAHVDPDDRVEDSNGSGRVVTAPHRSCTFSVAPATDTKTRTISTATIPRIERSSHAHVVFWNSRFHTPRQCAAQKRGANKWMREEAHRVAPSLTVHGPRPRTISKRQEEMFFWPPEHRAKRRNPAFFRHPGGNQTCLRWRGPRTTGQRRCVGQMGRAEPLMGERRVVPPLPRPQRRTAKGKRKGRGRAWLQRSPRRRAGRTARPLSSYGSPPSIGCPMTRPKIDALSEKNGRTPREKREAWCQDAPRGGSPADQLPLP